MTTENPKISTYIPQPLFDRFKEYQENNCCSMSSAVAAILAAFFETDMQGNRIFDMRDFEELEKRVRMIETKIQDSDG